VLCCHDDTYSDLASMPAHRVNCVNGPLRTTSPLHAGRKGVHGVVPSRRPRIPARPNNPMVRILPVLFAPLLLATVATAQAPAPAAARQPLRVLFLGQPDTPRGKDFAAFLGEHFAAVQLADRWQWEQSLLQEADVVVLDWPQDDGISAWMRKGDKTVVPKSLLGARADWTKPTVLVGSAGLNTAWAWDTKGAFG